MTRYIFLFISFLFAVFALKAEEFSIDYPFIFHENDKDFEYFYTLKFQTIEGDIKEVELIGFNNKDGGRWPLTVDIPATVIHNEKEYQVVSINKMFIFVEELSIPHTVRTIKQRLADNSIKSLIIDNAPLESLPEGFLESCTQIKSFSLGNACKFESIPSNCFSGCRSLEEIEIPESVKEIGNSAFAWCESLKKIKLGSKISKIDSHAFEGCSSLKNIDIPTSVREIWRAAFSSCTSLESITLPILEFWDSNTFTDCSSLKSVSIVSSEDSQLRIKIPENSFQNCNSLREFNCDPKMISDIYSNAFANCTSLSEFTLSSGSDINGNPFTGCSSLKKINVIEEKENPNLYSIDGALFSSRYGNSLLIYPSGKEDESFSVPDDVYAIGTGAFQGNAFIKNVILGNDISKIDNDAFKGCENLTSISLPENLVRIGAGAFEDAISLKEVNFSDNLEEIGHEAFKGTKALKVVTGGKNLKVIGNGAFTGAENLKEISLGGNLEEIGVMLFRDCKNLEKATFEEGITYVPSATFMGCSSLESVDLPQTCNYIGTSSFSDCSSLQTAPLPDQVKGIGESAFLGCSSIKSVNVPAGIKELKPNTFRDCVALTEVKLPSELNSIQRASFEGCSSLSSIEIPSEVSVLDERAFHSCKSLECVVIPDAVKVLGQGAFEECTSLMSIDTGNGVTEIGAWAFTNCTALESVNLGSSLKTIGVEAFEGDLNIREITCNSEEPPTYATGFPEEVLENAKVKVPAGCEDTYNTSFTWAPMVDGNDNVDYVPILVTEIIFDEASLTLELGQSSSITFSVYPEDADDKSLNWNSEDEMIATVSSEGVVMAHSVGSTIISAETKDGSEVRRECRVNVVNYNLNSVDSIFTNEIVKVDIYRVDGTCVVRNCNQDGFDSLPSGLYIVRTPHSAVKVNIP